MAERDEVLEALRRCVDQYHGLMRRGVDEGKVTQEGTITAAVGTMLRGMHRIAALPDDRDLTDDEVQEFQAALISIYCGAAYALTELPLPPGHFKAFAFDTRNPT